MLTFVALLWAAKAAQTAPQTADLVLLSANIYTADVRRPRAAAMAARAGRIVALGTNDQIKSWIGDGTEVLNLAGRTVLPGLIDSHGHMPSLGEVLSSIDLVGTPDYRSVIAKVVEKARITPKGEWIYGQGWDQNDWPVMEFPRHGPLSEAVPDHPVMLERIDGHAVLVNQKALELAGISGSTRDPEGGRIVRDADGAPTGVLIDAGARLITKVIPAPAPAERERRLLAAMRDCARQGLTMVHDAGIGKEDLLAYRALLERGTFPIRIYAMGSVRAGWSEELLEHGPEIGDRLMVRAIKVVSDGAMGSRGALMSAPYSDDPTNSGLETYPFDQLAKLAARARDRGIQMRVHAIGDLANTKTLDAFAGAFGGAPHPELRWAIEHAQVVRPEDIGRFAKLGIIASMQPTHATSDGPWAELRLGAERVQWSYAWRQFLSAGVRLASGSDFPVERVSPMLGFYAAMTRRDLDGKLPAGGWRPEEKLTPEETLRSFTLEGAYLAFREQDLGSLEIGKQADFVVLDRDPLASRTDAQKAQVLRTVVGGRTEYRSDAL
jgi:predicted amidohydrolase YtcJ